MGKTSASPRAGRVLRNPGARLPGETDEQFAAFRLYCGLGRKRSVLEVYVRHRLAAGCQLVPRTVPEEWRSWAKVNQWGKRARALDQQESQWRCDKLNALLEELEKNGAGEIGAEGALL